MTDCRDEPMKERDREFKVRMQSRIGCMIQKQEFSKVKNRSMDTKGIKSVKVAGNSSQTTIPGPGEDQQIHTTNVNNYNLEKRHERRMLPQCVLTE